MAAAIYIKIEACYDHSAKKINISLIFPADTSNGSLECGGGIQNNREAQEVKVRLPLNLKNMRERSAVCRPLGFLLMQLAERCVMCVRWHVQTKQET